MSYKILVVFLQGHALKMLNALNTNGMLIRLSVTSIKISVSVSYFNLSTQIDTAVALRF